MMFKSIKIDKKYIKNLFPIHSQTSEEDKIFLLNTIKFLHLNLKSYNYLEIGSYLGGSITPFLLDKKCKGVLSIDKRNLILPDERGENWDYKNISEKKMISNIIKKGIKTDKLKTFNGKIKDLKKRKKIYNLVFIDGEHTDINCFEDFINSMDFIKKDSIVIFHDSSVIFKAISLIFIYLNKKKIPYSFIKKKNSDMSAIFFGKFLNKNFKKNYGKIDNNDKFFTNAMNYILLNQSNNKLKVKFRLSKFLKGKYPFKYVLGNTKNKIVRKLNESIS